MDMDKELFLGTQIFRFCLFSGATPTQCLSLGIKLLFFLASMGFSLDWIYFRAVSAMELLSRTTLDVLHLEMTVDHFVSNF